MSLFPWQAHVLRQPRVQFLMVGKEFFKRPLGVDTCFTQFLVGEATEWRSIRMRPYRGSTGPADPAGPSQLVISSPVPFFFRDKLGWLVTVRADRISCS